MRVIIIIPLPQMAQSQLPPPPPARPLSVVPRDMKGLGLSLAASRAPSQGSAGACLQLTGSFFRCKGPSSCQQAAPRRGTSGVLGAEGVVS